MTLKIKAFNNYGQFDELQISQCAQFHGDLREYKIHKPKGNWPTIRHNRNDGWLVLMKKVIKILERT